MTMEAGAARQAAREPASRHPSAAAIAANSVANEPGGRGQSVGTSGAPAESGSLGGRPTAPGGSPRWGHAVRLAAMAGVAVGLVFLARRLDVSAVKAALGHARRDLLVAAVLLSCLSQWAKAFLWRVMLDAPPSVTTGRLFRYAASTLTLSMVTPMRAGEALRPWLLWRNHAVPLGRSAGVALTEKLMDVLSLMVLLAPLPWLVPPLPHWVGRAVALLGIFGVGILGASVLAARRLPARGRVGRLVRGMRVLRERGAFLRAFGVAVVVWLFDLAALWVSLRAVGIHQGYAGAAFVLLGVNAALLVPASPGNVGTLEAGAVLALGLLGVPRPAATAGALLYHAAQLLPLLLVALLGISSTLDLLRAPRLRRSAERDPRAVTGREPEMAPRRSGPLSEDAVP